MSPQCGPDNFFSLSYVPRDFVPPHKLILCVTSRCLLSKRAGLLPERERGFHLPVIYRD